MPASVFRHHKIIVALPIYNEERHVAEAIRSLKAQDWSDFLAVISDNASTDRTEAICRETIAEDPRFHYVRHEENGGSAFNFNYVLDATQSPYFVWMGGHDVIAPGFLSSHLAALDKHPECSFSYSPVMEIDESGNIRRSLPDSHFEKLRGGPIRRYLGSIDNPTYCFEINSVIRRVALGTMRLSAVPGCDRAMLSGLLFHGPAYKIDEPLYFARLKVSSQGYMEKLAGKNVSAGHAERISHYIDHFSSMVKHRWYRVIPVWIATYIVRRRWDPDFVSDRKVRNFIRRRVIARFR